MKPHKTDKQASVGRLAFDADHLRMLVQRALGRPRALAVPALFLVGIVIVYMLGLRAGPRQASADEQQNEMRVEAALVRLDTAEADDDRNAKEVVESFYTDTRRRQVPIDELVRNAFVFEPRGREADEDGPLSGTEYGSERSGLHQAVARAKTLNLQSVLKGSGSSRALISDTLVSQGETIAGWTVEEIRPRSVVLTWEEHRFVLEMPQ